MVLQAVEKAHIDATFTNESAPSEQSSSALFIGADTAQTKPAAAKVILDVRLHAQDVEVLQNLVVEHGLKDRTDLINQALERFLASVR